MWRADDLRPPGNQKEARRRVMGGAGARAGVLLAVLAVGSLAIVGYGHRKPITLPRPDGPFAVGRLVTAVVFPKDAPSTAMAEGIRIVWCWYPAPSNSRAARAPYLPPAWRDALESHRGPLMSTLVNRDLSRVFGHSLDHPPVAALDSPMRLVFLRAGLAALTVDYTSLAEHLASYGYMVVGIDAPGRTALVVLPDRRVVTRPAHEDPERLRGDARARAVDQLIDAWADDMVELADGLGTSGSWLPGFEGRFDATRVSIVGHSLGGPPPPSFAGVTRDATSASTSMAHSDRESSSTGCGVLSHSFSVTTVLALTRRARRLPTTSRAYSGDCRRVPAGAEPFEAPITSASATRCWFETLLLSWCSARWASWRWTRAAD